jgi:hypothetical protein
MASEFKDSAERAVMSLSTNPAIAYALLYIGEQLEKLVELQEKNQVCEGPEITLGPSREPEIDLELLGRLKSMSGKWTKD